MREDCMSLLTIVVAFDDSCEDNLLAIHNLRLLACILRLRRGLGGGEGRQQSSIVHFLLGGEVMS